jgi:hypothetical protein
MKSESASVGLGAGRAPQPLGSGRRDDLDLPGLELGADLGELLLVEVVLERERLQGGLLDRRVSPRPRRGTRGQCKFKHGAQFLHTSFTFVGVRRTRAFATNT